MDQAYSWLCSQRENHSDNNSIWDLSFNWIETRSQLQQELVSGTYLFSPLISHNINGEYLSSWDAQDALVLKALTYVLQPLFSINAYTHCTHLKSAGGIHAAVKQVSTERHYYKHVLKSDVWHYYESVDHEVLLSAIRKKIECPILIDLIAQYAARVEIKVHRTLCSSMDIVGKRVVNVLYKQ